MPVDTQNQNLERLEQQFIHKIKITNTYRRFLWCLVQGIHFSRNDFQIQVLTLPVNAWNQQRVVAATSKQDVLPLIF